MLGLKVKFGASLPGLNSPVVFLLLPVPRLCLLCSNNMAFCRCHMLIVRLGIVCLVYLLFYLFIWFVRTCLRKVFFTLVPTWSYFPSPFLFLVPNYTANLLSALSNFSSLFYCSAPSQFVFVHPFLGSTIVHFSLLFNLLPVAFFVICLFGYEYLDPAL